MFSMTSPAERLALLPAELRSVARLAGAAPANLRDNSSSGLSSGWLTFDQRLPDGGLPPGQVTELACRGQGGLATTLALGFLRVAQQQGVLAGSAPLWGAFVDPGASLFAPGVAQSGVLLERLLVVRPTPEDTAATSLRLVRSGVCSLVVIDLAGAPGCPLSLPLGPWARTVRQLSLGLQGTGTAVLLLTRLEVARPLVLPVALRLEVERSGPRELSMRVGKDRQGRVGGWAPVRASEPREPLQMTLVSHGR